MFKKAIIAGAVLAAVSGAHAATTANLTITGTITPAACDLTLSAGNVNLGTLQVATVQAGAVIGPVGSQQYSVAQGSVGLNVICSAPLAFALYANDNRASSLMGLGDSADEVRFGLGTSGGTNIGHVAFWMPDAQVTTTVGGVAAAAAGTLNRVGTTGPWTSGPAAVFLSHAAAQAFQSGAGQTSPVPLAALTSTVNVLPFINKSLVDSATSAINVDGAITVVLQYI
jgi:hypothetical protein